MAALTGYLYGLDVLTKVSHDTSDDYADVFSPAFQTLGNVHDIIFEQADFHTINVYNRIWQAESSKKKEGRYLKGAANVGGGVNGEILGRYTDDFYHRIHLTPSQLRLGNLTSAQTREIEVWNAFFFDVTLEDVQSLNADGLTIVPPVGTPYVMGALEPLVYVINISTDGPPSIDATLRWIVTDSYNGTANYDARVTGNRVIAIPMVPNWATTMEETLEWKTDVIKSYNGQEQRARIRAKPRRGQTYSYTLKGEDANRLENLLWGWQNRLFAVPHWTETALNQTELYVGQTGIPVTTDSYSYTPGCLIFITNGEKYEMQEVEDVQDGLVLLKKGLDNDWGRPTVMGPANLARIDGDLNVKLKRETANVTNSTLQFVHEPVQTDPYIPELAYTDTYKTSEILLKEPNWKGGSNVQYDSEGKVMDYGLQGFSIAIRSGKPDIVQEYEWFLNGREQMKWFRGFLSRRKGRFNGFWMPTWNNDFTIIDTVAGGSTGFKATENYYGLLVDGDNGRNHVLVELKDGTQILRQISAASIEVDGTTLDVVTDETMGVTFSPDQVKRVSLVGWYRLYNDRIKIRYEDRNFASVKMSLINVLP